mmetsp:Transcript_15552/g.41744  ORF Transcript_15552/g.41744 Transcript_15552/m.41744 type:complete len:235 (-) Transcript_15552:870-1574(-)
MLPGAMPCPKGLLISRGAGRKAYRALDLRWATASSSRSTCFATLSCTTVVYTNQRMRPTTNASHASLTAGVELTAASSAPREICPSVLETKCSSSCICRAPSLFLSQRCSTRLATAVRPFTSSAKSWKSLRSPWSSMPLCDPNLLSITCGANLDCFLNSARMSRRFFMPKSAMEIGVPSVVVSTASMGRTAVVSTVSKKLLPKSATKKQAWPDTLSTALPATTAVKKVQKGMSR